MSRWIDQSSIGSGGFGEVSTCLKDGQGQLFAKKKLHSGDSVAVERFIREVRILSVLDHPNIVRVVAKKLETAPYFYIMPLYSHSLASELSTVVGDERRIFPIFKAVLDGIEYAHSQGVIHRDLKPENILMNNDADIVVSDFGLGRIIDSKSTRKTQTGWKMGTPLYMPPEQLLDAKAADERSDIFSLGRILYELYSGPLTSAVQDTSSLPVAIALIIERCTQRDPDRRFQRVSDLKQAWMSLYDVENEESDRADIKKLVVEMSAAQNSKIKTEPNYSTSWHDMKMIQICCTNP
jgi:eukaryotic-like serine/threonine-protein kinase